MTCYDLKSTEADHRGPQEKDNRQKLMKSRWRADESLPFMSQLRIRGNLIYLYNLSKFLYILSSPSNLVYI